jgi:hypothetical protein
MKTQSVDTHPKAEEQMIEMQRNMPMWQKLRMLDDLMDFARGLAKMGIRQSYPHASPEEVHMRFLSRTTPRHVMIELFQWDPEDHQ